MRRAMAVLLSLASMALMVSSVCAVPNVSYAEAERMSDENIEVRIDSVLASRQLRMMEKLLPGPYGESERIVTGALRGTSVVDEPYYPRLVSLLSKILGMLLSLIGGRTIGKMMSFAIVSFMALAASVMVGLGSIPGAVMTIVAMDVGLLAYLIENLEPMFLFGIFGISLVFIAFLPFALLFFLIGIPALVLFNIIEAFQDTLKHVMESQGS